MKHTYVPCNRCLDYDLDRRYYSPCSRCKNTGYIINPSERLCNLCGEYLCPKDDEQSPYGLVDAEVSAGYFSYHLSDMTRYTFSLCEKCLREIFNRCKIKPEINGALSADDYNDDQKQYEYLLFRDNGEHHQAYLEARCNQTIKCPNKTLYTLRYTEDTFTEECACEEHKDSKPSMSEYRTKFISNNLKAFL